MFERGESLVVLFEGDEFLAELEVHLEVSEGIDFPAVVVEFLCHEECARQIAGESVCVVSLLETVQALVAVSGLFEFFGGVEFGGDGFQSLGFFEDVETALDGICRLEQRFCGIDGHGSADGDGGDVPVDEGEFLLEGVNLGVELFLGVTGFLVTHDGVHELVNFYVEDGGLFKHFELNV